MSTYRISVVTECLYVDAKSTAEAEAKYDAWFTQSDCPEHSQPLDECECVEYQEEVDHDIRVWA